MSNNGLSFLLSGPGLIGKQHAKLLMSRPDCSLTAIVAPGHAHNESFALECGAKFFLTSDEALRREHFDAAIISSPNPFHFDQAAACIQNGIAVLVEKPVTDSVDDARRLVELAERLKVPVLVGHHRTYSPLLEAIEQFLNSPLFGRPVALQGSALFYKPARYFEDGAWRTRKGGGPILINLIHEIGLMRLFYGEIKSVSALAGRNIRNFEVEDSVAITFNFVNGALGTFLLSDTAASTKSWEMTSGENPAYPYFPAENCYHFAGTNGSLDFPSMHARYYAPGSEPSWWNQFETVQIPFRQGNPLERQLDHFVDVVCGRAAPRVSARDGYLNMLVVQAIMQSIATEKVVNVEDTLVVGS
jgi:predicted dehydrogenase